MRAHALLNASSSHRWLECTPSPRLEAQFPDTRSTYAEEGTFAHELAEIQLTLKTFETMAPKVYNSLMKRLNELKKSELYSASMTEYIDQYITIVLEKYHEAKKSCKDTLILLEQKLDFSEWVPDGFGTGDVVIISDNILEIIDLKYGQGVPVSAEGNSQMRLYGLGAINQYGLLYDFDRIRMTIVQPRLDSVSSDEMTVADLLEWGETYVKPRAALAMAGEGEFVPGDHCQFCKAKAQCRARAEANLAMARYDFQKPELLTNDEIAEILAEAERLQKWAKDVQEYALDQAVNHGVKFPGWKLVEGRSNRKYSDPEAVAAKLRAEGYSPDVIYRPQELWGITEMQKKLGKKLFEKYLGDLIIKPAGKPTLVPESDKRPEISSVASAVEDFKDEDILG